jgi:hypothetical protein
MEVFCFEVQIYRIEVLLWLPTNTTYCRLAHPNHMPSLVQRAKQQRQPTTRRGWSYENFADLVWIESPLQRRVLEQPSLLNPVLLRFALSRPPRCAFQTKKDTHARRHEKCRLRRIGPRPRRRHRWLAARLLLRCAIMCRYELIMHQRMMSSEVNRPPAGCAVAGLADR